MSNIHPAKVISVLLADDELSVIEGLKEVIEWSRYNLKLIGCAKDGIEALKLILEFRPDIAVVDINMPGINGLALIDEACTNNIQTSFIILSGFREFTYAQQAIKLGAAAYLLKPVNSEELNSQIGQLCIELTGSSSIPMNQNYIGKLITDYFNRLVEGKQSDLSAVSSFTQSLGLNISMGSCYIMLITFEYAVSEPDKYLNLISKSLHDEKHIAWMISADTIAILLNPSSELPFHLALKVINTLSTNSGESPIIGIGDQVASIINSSYSYERAATALTYRIFDSQMKIFTYEIICTTPPTLRLQAIDYLPLVSSIVKREHNSIINFCNSFTDQLLYVKFPPPNYVYSMCYALYSKIQNEFSNFIKENINGFADSKDLYQCTSIQQIQSWLADSFCKLSDFIDAIYGYSDKGSLQKTDIGNINDQIISDAIKYISENITGVLKIEDIAQNVHLSTSYFATYFKEKTGTGLRDFLLETKMQYAARILHSGTKSINELALELGYSDYRSFSRAFKKIYGCTPSDFQNK